MKENAMICDESTIEQFFQSDILIKNKIPYKDALSEVADILIDGITVKQ